MSHGVPMRNIREYPVTKEEMVRVLTEESQRILTEMRMGDMRSMIFSLAATIVAESDFTDSNSLFRASESL